MSNSVTVTKIETCAQTGTRWVLLNGTDNGTGIEFQNETIGVTNRGVIVDCDGIPIYIGDNYHIAIRNSGVE